VRTALPVLCAVLGNVLYHCAQKLTPAQANPFLTLAVSFGAASAGCLALYFAAGGKGLRADAAGLSWTALGLGASIIIIELGILMAYRAGWRIGVTSLVVTVGLTAILLPVGRLFFAEQLTWTGAAGVALSLVGLGLITLQARPQ
jgi:hypothetical protein